MSILCIGQACWDLVFTMDSHPGPDEKTIASHLISCGGGPAANAAVAIRRLGHASAFLGYLGQDPLSQLHFRELESEGVITQYVIIGDVPAPVSTILVNKDGKRAVINYNGNTGFLDKSPHELDEIKPELIIFDGHAPIISNVIARQAKSMHIPMVLDAGSVHKGTLDLIHQVDHVVASEIFSRTFTGTSSAEKAAAIIAEICPRVVITMGEKGLVWKMDGSKGNLPAYSIQPVDSTGAGDAFHGAYCFGLIKQMKTEDLLSFASAAGALCCGRLGARPGLPTRSEIAAFLSSQ